MKLFPKKPTPTQQLEQEFDNHQLRSEFVVPKEFDAKIAFLKQNGVSIPALQAQEAKIIATFTEIQDIADLMGWCRKYVADLPTTLPDSQYKLKQVIDTLKSIDPTEKSFIELRGAITANFGEMYASAHSLDESLPENTELKKMLIKIALSVLSNLALAGHAHAATTLGDFHNNSQSSNSTVYRPNLAGIYFLIGTVMPNRPNGIDQLNAVRGAELLLKARGVTDELRELARKILITVLCQDTKSQHGRSAASKLSEFHIARAMEGGEPSIDRHPNTTSLALATLRTESQRDLNDLGYAVFFARYSFTNEDQAPNFLLAVIRDLHFRVILSRAPSSEENPLPANFEDVDRGISSVVTQLDSRARIKVFCPTEEPPGELFSARLRRLEAASRRLEGASSSQPGAIIKR